MESKLFIHLNRHKEVNIRVTHTRSEDVRDEMVSMFLWECCPNQMEDGFAIVRPQETLDLNVVKAEVIPIHPFDALKHIETMVFNVKKTCGDGPGVPHGWEKRLEDVIHFLETELRDYRKSQRGRQEPAEPMYNA